MSKEKGVFILGGLSLLVLAVAVVFFGLPNASGLYFNGVNCMNSSIPNGTVCGYSNSNDTMICRSLQCVFMGDLNNDSYMNVQDINLFNVVLAGNGTYYQRTVADMNCNGAVNVQDVNWFVSALSNYKTYSRTSPCFNQSYYN